MKTIPSPLTRMISEVPIIWLLSLCSMGSIVAIVFGCVCGCRKKVPKPSSATATATRSLPDLPVEPGVSAWDHNDTSSDLYATVEENKSDKRRCLMQSQSGDDGYNSPTQTDDSLSPYARVKGEHPYDQLKQSEHPYAQVHANGIPAGSIPKHNRPNSAIASASTQSADNERADSSSPIAPPRMRKSLTGLSDSSLPDSIAAATAIAGGIPANQELPYMTPPLITAPANHTQQHFSGDSQDSSKGYTSISVREPLATILGERSRSQRQDLIDSHYMTVSDDSDEMYAAIEEPGGQAVYTSGSETYARIRPNPSPQTRPPAEETVERPPSQQARRTSHSRQASSSSAASSGVSPNSPKPEKRQANSPLPRPPPPPSDAGLSAPAAAAAVDDMYAKVMKKRRSSQSVTSLEEQQQHLAAGAVSDGASAAAPPGYERLSPQAEPNYEELKPQDLKPTRSPIESNYAKVNKNRPKNNNSKPLSVEPAYASLSRKDSGHDPDYESVSANSQNDPNYESLEKTDSENDPPYEKLQSTSSASLDDDYETVFRVDSTQVYSRMEERDS